MGLGLGLGLGLGVGLARARDVRPDGGVEDIDAHDDALHAGGRQAVHGAGAVGQLTVEEDGPAEAIIRLEPSGRLARLPVALEGARLAWLGLGLGLGFG